MSSSTTRIEVSTCSCWPMRSLPISGSAFAFPSDAACAGAAAPRPGSFSAPILIAIFFLPILACVSLSWCVWLAQELAVARDDGQVHELRPGVVLRRIADEKAAEVDVLHLFHGVD